MWGGVSFYAMSSVALGGGGGRISLGKLLRCVQTSGLDSLPAAGRVVVVVVVPSALSPLC